MIIRATAIPLACYPYSSTSQIVHWLTRYQGKVSTVLKGAMRPRSPFLGEYDLFSTSELLYFEKRTHTLHAGKECAMLHRRDRFRSDWRAMQAASYLTALINRTTPEEAPHPELFVLFDELLDLAEEYGRHTNFVPWAELQFSRHHGHTPHLADCVLCGSIKELRFCASQGGTVCAVCSRKHKLPMIDCAPDVIAMLQTWLRADHPAGPVKTQLTPRQSLALNAVMSTFMMYQFSLPPNLREKLFIQA
ncbi:MAG: DNA repair protein RecO [Pontiellaceae bacterium]|nr:DNA repair protein RecO [Pontiellaceae bacterium]MBN2783984.1 DNA repair protein RecO [Pontiellaceae bacterium]